MSGQPHSADASQSLHELLAKSEQLLEQSEELRQQLDHALQKKNAIDPSQDITQKEGDAAES